jgi:hypothetical protein
MSLLLIGVMILGALPVKAGKPQAGIWWYYWYSETITLGDAKLPAGINIQGTDTSNVPRATLTLENHTDTLLFVLSLNYKDVLVMVTPAPNWKARVNMAHEVASYLVAKDKPAILDMQALADLDLSLVDRNALSPYPPPTDRKVPEQQQSELLLVYGGQVYSVPFTVSYALNLPADSRVAVHPLLLVNTQETNLARATVTPQADAVITNAVRNNLVVIGLGGLAAVFIIGWLAWKGLSQQR